MEINLETGEVTNIIIYIGDENKKNSNNTILIEKVEIGETKKENTDNELSKEEIDEIHKLLKENYNIDSEIVTINSI